MNDTKRQGAAGPAIPDLSIPSEEGASPPAHLHDGENHDDNSIMGFLHRLDMTYGPPVKRILMHPDFPDHCAVRGGGAVVAGGAMGVMFGLFFSGITDQGQPLKPDFKGQVKDVARSMYRSATSMAKGFAVFGGVFVAFECIIEKVRCCSLSFTLSLSLISFFFLSLFFSLVSGFWFLCLFFYSSLFLLALSLFLKTLLFCATSNSGEDKPTSKTHCLPEHALALSLALDVISFPVFLQALVFSFSLPFFFLCCFLSFFPVSAFLVRSFLHSLFSIQRA
ncbi:Mitochondrial import inner membrane translocase subunit Tim22, variant 2 [Balamuthia mandrillaris]